MLDISKFVKWSEECFVVNPTALLAPSQQKVVKIELPFEGLRLQIPPTSSLRSFWDKVKGNTVKLSSDLVSAEVFRLITTRTIVPTRFSEVASIGLTSHARTYSTWDTVDFAQLKSAPVIIGSAVDFAQVGERTSFASPSIIRSLISKCKQDIGNINWLPVDGIERYGSRLAYSVWLCRIQGALPVILGGDHTLTKYSFEECRKHVGKIGLIQFDAHNDLGLSGVPYEEALTHANVIGHIAKAGCEFIAQVGLRNNELIERRTVHGTPIYQLSHRTTISEFDLFLQGITERHPGISIYLSIDLDCVDPVEAPEVTTPLNGGLSEPSLLEMVRSLLNHFKAITCIDLVEVVSSNSPNNRAAKIAARIVDSIE